VLKSSDIAPYYLPNTKDIWARDYMPIQISKDKFIEYRYDPDYLQAKKYRKLKSYTDIICDTIGLKTTKTDIILDGGNVIKSNNCVILTDKAVQENRDLYTKKELINKLYELFEVDKVVLIPWDKEEIYGHADGMIRFINEDTVLVQDYYDEYSETFRNKFYGALESNNLNWIKLKFDGENVDERSWSYMNFLQTKDIILLPSFGIPEDKEALEQIKKYYPDYADGKIHQIDWNEMIDGEGSLNCISWTIKD
jgi:agmatine/peptidylarginine deiminase